MKIMFTDTSRLKSMKGSYSIYNGVNVNGMGRSGCIAWNTIRNIFRLLIYNNQ